AMRMRGLEPPRALAHTDLNRARLPIPPHPPAATFYPAPSLSQDQAGLRTMIGLRKLAQLGAAAAAALLLASPALAGGAGSDRVEVVVTLAAPGLARSVQLSRVLTPRAKARRLVLSSLPSAAYLRDLDQAQRTLERRIVRAIPSARVRWRYGVVLDGL